MTSLEFYLSRGPVRDLTPHGTLDSHGRLIVHPAEFWAQFSREEIGAFCVAHGIYCIPTTELVAWLKNEIGSRKAIEIGAGNGVLADALGIPATDNRMQERPDIRAHYEALGQATVPYGPNVRKLDAEKAVRLLKPQVVVAAWVTHKFRAHEAWREGNVYGVAEENIVQAAQYIFVGNEHVHRDKPIFELPHRAYRFPWLVARTLNDTPNFVGVWERQRY